MHYIATCFSHSDIKDYIAEFTLNDPYINPSKNMNNVLFSIHFTFNYDHPNGVDYIQSKLNDSLRKNAKYCVRFYVSLADNMLYATNVLGAYFSKAPVGNSTDWVLNYQP